MAKVKIVHRLDPLLRSNDVALCRAVAVLGQDLAKREAQRDTRIRDRKEADQAKFDLTVECLLVNFVAALALSPEAVVAVPLSNTVLRGRPRYRPEVYGKHFRDLIALLQALGLIAMVTKGYNVRQYGRSELTTVRPTTKLIKLFPPLAAPRTYVGRLGRVEHPEVVVLKDEDGELADYPETKDTRRWREDIRAINKSLEGMSMSVDARSVVDEDGFAIQPLARSLRRIWNNSDWKQGGRLYGAFWQTMRRDDRLPAISIDGEPIANVDFSQFNLRLAYALAKAKPPRGDLYDITGQDSADRDWLRLREGRKKVVNAMFNSSSPLKGWPAKTPEERAALKARFPTGTSISDERDRIRQKHAAIADYFESAHGLAFMRIESDILVASLLSLMKRGIVALPIHDAVLVQERFAETAKATLERESKTLVGTAIPAEIKKLSD